MARGNGLARHLIARESLESGFVRIAPFLILALAACGGSASIPGEELLLRIEAQDEVELGRAFPLTVVRVWSRDLTPAVWNDQLLAPLKLKLLDTRRRENERRVEETRRYEGYAFTLGDVTVPAPEFRAVARQGGAERVMTADALEIKVRAALDPTDTGEAELPGETLTPSRAWMYWTLGFVMLLAAGAVLLLRKRATVPPPPAPPTDDTPSAATIALAQLAGCTVLDLPDVLRSYIAARFGVRTAESSSEELLQNAAIERRDLLGEVLRVCDLAKFACLAPNDQESETALGTAIRFVEATA